MVGKHLDNLGAQRLSGWLLSGSTVLLASLTVSLPATATPIAPDPQGPIAQSFSTTDREANYWLRARRLLAERLYTLIATREALLLPDPDAIAGVDLDLYENVLKTDRFLREFSADFDESGCGSTPIARDDVLVYCALALTQPTIEAFFEPLREQQDAIADLPPSSLLPDAIAIGTPGEPDRLATADDDTTTFDAAPPLPGVTAKPPLARTPRRVVPPAYSPPPELLDRLDGIVVSLLVAREALPAAFAIALPSDEMDSQSAPIAAAGFSTPAGSTPTEPDELQPRAAIPSHTARPNPADNRILSDASYMPLVSAAPLVTVPGLPNAMEESFVPSLLLEVAGDRLAVVSMGFDFGAIADLGEVDLEALTLESALDGLDPELRAAFGDYRPPETFAALHADRQRARTGKTEALGVPDGVAISLPAIADRVYLFRSIQYSLPEFIETGRALYAEERRYLAGALETPSFDATIAVQLLESTADGGYLIRWRLLERFPDPQIVDLHNYTNERTGRTAR